MILGHAKCGQWQDALANLDQQVQLEGIKPDPVTFVGILKACTSVAGIEEEKVFKRMPTGNMVAWSAMIQAHVKCVQGQKAAALSQQMQREGVEPDPAIFVAVLSACAM
ncbi:unnamed protein product [Sphagnum jensenii]|uniref:Pentatricopeptide repeat-containing protein n=1 Tax=Sphagnum jensenii TaxID=128206 RepID=A0ABP0W1B8_9BRYO